MSMLEHESSRSQPVSEEEMRELVRRLEAMNASTTTSTADVAEALSIPESEVQRMLSQIRSENTAVGQTTASKVRSRGPVLAILIVALLIGSALLIALVTLSPAPGPVLAPPKTVKVELAPTAPEAPVIAGTPGK